MLMKKKSQIGDDIVYGGSPRAKNAVTASFAALGARAPLRFAASELDNNFSLCSVAATVQRDSSVVAKGDRGGGGGARLLNPLHRRSV